MVIDLKGTEGNDLTMELTLKLFWAHYDIIHKKYQRVLNQFPVKKLVKMLLAQQSYKNIEKRSNLVIDLKGPEGNDLILEMT